MEANGDFNYAVLSAVEYYLYRKRSLRNTNQDYDMGDAIVFMFVKGNGTPDKFGTNKTIFV